MSAPASGAIPLDELERVLEDACGLSLSPGIRRTLGDAFHRAAHELRLAPELFLARLRAGESRAVTTLVEAAVVGETYFFRHPEQLAALRQVVFAPAPREEPLLVWSAGCATGEEPYTLAMELVDAGRAGAGDRILATDVSARALAVAREAVYGEWSLRRLDPVLRERHFEAQGQRVVVRDALRTGVELQRHNLLRDPVPGKGFHLVVCRNVLIYFSPSTALAVVEKLASALRPGGALLLGPVEAPLATALPLERIEVEGATLFRTPGGPASARTPTPVPRRASPGPLQPAPSTGADALRVPRRPHPSPAPRRAAPSSPQPGAVPAAHPAPAPETFAEVATLAAARAAARRGDLPAAEQLARAAASRELCPEAWLLVSMASEARDDLPGAVEAARRALYLDPGLALGHATLIPLYARLGLAEDAARARRNALEALAGLDDAAALRGAEGITAGALRSALEGDRRPARAATGDITGSVG